MAPASTSPRQKRTASAGKPRDHRAYVAAVRQKPARGRSVLRVLGPTSGIAEDFEIELWSHTGHYQTLLARV